MEVKSPKKKKKTRENQKEKTNREDKELEAQTCLLPLKPNLHTLHSSFSTTPPRGFLSPSSSLVSSLAFSLSCRIKSSVEEVLRWV